MILEGNARGYGAELARHLLNARDNEHVTVHAIEGFVADDVTGAFAEAEAISKATQCQKYLFSLSLNPPPDAEVSVEVFEQAIATAEACLGLAGQPKAIVFHEKNGRRHAHAVWSRINGQRLKAINLPHFKRRLMGLSQELYQAQGWDMPKGFREAQNRDPLNFSRQEAGQAKRQKCDAKALKAMFRACWAASDSRAGFEAALREQGFALARGDRRGFVAVDAAGKIWSLSRWCGVTPKDMRARLGPETALPSVRDITPGSDLPEQPRDPRSAVLEVRRAKLVARQRAERDALIQHQETRRIEDLKARQRRMPKGLRGAFARMTGRYETLLHQCDAETRAAEARDQVARDALIARHLSERQDLARDAHRQGVSSAFHRQNDPRQSLVLQEDALPYSAAELIKSPALAATHLSQTKASFTRTDILRTLAKRIDDPLTLQWAADQALASAEVERVSEDDQPPTYTTRDFLRAEKALDQIATALSASGGYAVDRSHVERAIKKQNAEMRRAFGGSLSAEQRAALDHVLGGRQLASVVGLAGAGKSTLLATAKDAWAQQGVTVHGAALAGKAAEELQSASGIASRTLASLELLWKNGHAPIAQGDVLVVDEAGMIGTRQLSRVAAKCHEIGAKLVLVGDPDQLQPIEAGTPFRRLVETRGAARLTDIHRQKEGWQKQASRDLAAGDIGQAVEAYRKRDAVWQTRDGETAIDAIAESYAMDVAASGRATSRLAFAHKRKDVHALNQAIRAALRSGDENKPEMLFTTETGKRAFASDDRIVFTRNDKEIGVKNGMLGTVITAETGEITVALDGDTKRLVRFDPQQFRNFDHGYAVTIHKSQGATVDHSYVLGSRSMDRHLAYVAMTRHRSNMRLVLSDHDRPSWAQNHRHRTPTQTIHIRSGPSLG